jgi:low molecular weight protein-tyrosine phosphatase
MASILFVCLGNICRSPSAEAIFRTVVADAGLQDKITIDSAGTGAWHIGNPPDERAQKVGRRLGFDLSDLRGRQVSLEDFDNFDIIIPMDLSNRANLKRMAPDHFKGDISLMMSFVGQPDGEVPDPYYGDISDYENMYQLVLPAADGLLRHVRQKFEI